MGDDLKRALEPAGDIAVIASAGTGKTTRLMKLYLEELCKERNGKFTDVNSIAAITFTVKAANEMIDRIRGEIKNEIDNLANADPINGSSANLSKDDSSWNKEKRLLAHLIRQRQALNSAHISTIHSFCMRLLYEFSNVAGVDPMFRVMGESESRELLDSVTLKEIRNGLGTLNEGIERLVLCYGLSKLQSHIQDIIFLSRSWGIGLSQMKTKRHVTLVELREKRKETIDGLKNMLPELSGYGGKSYEAKLYKMIEEIPDLLDIDIELDRKTAFKLFKVGKEYLKGAGNRKITSPEPARTASKYVLDICLLALEKDESYIVKDFSMLMGRVSQKYLNAKDRLAVLDFTDLEEKALGLLEKNPSVVELLKNRFNRILVDEYQDINGLQDKIISYLAPPGDRRLAIAGDPKQSIYLFRGAVPTIFGDTVEKIKSANGSCERLTVNYRSTPSLVKFFNDFFQGPHVLGGQFSKEDLITPDSSLQGQHTASPVMLIDCTNELNNKDLSAMDTRKLEAKKIAAHISGLIESKRTIYGKEEKKPIPIEYDHIAILLKTFTNHKVYQKALRVRGIPCQVVGGRGFYQTKEIKDFSNILSFLYYSGDLLSLISVLRSPLVGISDDGLLKLRRDENGNERDTVDLFLKQLDFPSGMRKEDQYRIELFRNKVIRWKELRDCVMPSELLEMILVDTGYNSVMMGSLNGDQAMANIFKLIEMTRLHEAKGGSLGKFILRLKQRISQGLDSPEADISADVINKGKVRVMTIHQSKGQEFPVVFVADMTGGRRSSNYKRINISSTVGLGARIYDLEDKEWVDGPAFQINKTNDAEEEEKEFKRLLYVATTRAEDFLVYSGGSGKGTWMNPIREFIDCNHVNDVLMIKSPTKSGQDISPIVDLIITGNRPYLVDEKKAIKKLDMEALIHEVKVTVTELAMFKQCPRRYYYQKVISSDNVLTGKSSIGKRKDESAISNGNNVHSFLEKAPIGKGNDLVELEKAILSYFKDFSQKQKGSLAKSITNAFVESPLRGIWSVEPGAIMREMPIAVKLVDDDIILTLTGAVDIIWFDGERWMVADYKYSERPKDELAYFFQIKLYALAVMLAHNMDTLGAAVVYLKERSKMSSFINFSHQDGIELGKQALETARQLVRVEGKPEESWSQCEEKLCREQNCKYLGLCWVNA